MSSDNGIYVLYTESDKGPEYRVANVCAIDNVYGKFNETTQSYEGDVELLKETFGNSEVFYSLNEALDRAEQMEYDAEYLEYGISVINEFRDLGYIFKVQE